MGRYCTTSTDDEYKFWFAIQPSDDILLFTQEEQPQAIFSCAGPEDIPNIQETIADYKSQFKETTGKSFTEFEDNEEVQHSNLWAFLQTIGEPVSKEQKAAMLIAARICLGNFVLKQVKSADDLVSFTSEV
jgi:hypothetical protein